MSSLIENDQIVSYLRSAVMNGESNLQNIPGLLKRIIKEEMWRERFVGKIGQTVTFDDFEEFVRTDPLEGLGEDLDILKRLCVHDEEALGLIAEVTKGEHGGDRRSECFKRVNHPLETEEKQDRSDKHRLRLQSQRPDLYQQVLDGKTTIYRASVEAGFYPARIAVNLRSAQSAAATLKRAASDEFIAELIDLLK